VNFTYPDGSVEKYSYDNNSNTIQKIDRKNIQASYTYTYDLLNASS
jgi:YD repeat-containing protein